VRRCAAQCSGGMSEALIGGPPAHSGLADNGDAQSCRYAQVFLPPKKLSTGSQFGEDSRCDGDRGSGGSACRRLSLIAVRYPFGIAVGMIPAACEAGSGSLPEE
jgi:hypothetical protein